MTILEPMTTPLDWADAVLDALTLKQVGEIRRWVEHRAPLKSAWRRYRALFHGGPAKRLAVALLGQACGVPVYRIDVGKVVGKHAGETEKNLETAFKRAARQGAILFFDEADVLFGKRTQSRSANDRAANQQIAYLLQRIEDFPGIVILATNLRSRVDDAFARRFQSVIRFRAPASSRARRVSRRSR